MTRAEYEARSERAQAFKKLMAMPEWCVVDELLVKLFTDASSYPALNLPRESLTRVYDMLTGRQECVTLIQNAFREWIEDQTLTPEQIDAEAVPPLE